MNKPLQHTLLTQQHTSPHVHMPTTRSGTHSVHVLLQSRVCLLHYFHATQLSKKHAQRKGHTCMHAHTLNFEAAQPSAAHARLLCRGHADCMSYSNISMLRAWSCVSTTLPPSGHLSFMPLSLSSVLPPSLYSILTGSAAPSIPHVELSTSSCTT